MNGRMRAKQFLAFLAFSELTLEVYLHDLICNRTKTNVYFSMTFQHTNVLIMSEGLSLLCFEAIVSFDANT